MPGRCAVAAFYVFAAESTTDQEKQFGNLYFFLKRQKGKFSKEPGEEKKLKWSHLQLIILKFLNLAQNIRRFVFGRLFVVAMFFFSINLIPMESILFPLKWCHTCICGLSPLNSHLHSLWLNELQKALYTARIHIYSIHPLTHIHLADRTSKPQKLVEEAVCGQAGEQHEEEVQAGVAVCSSSTCCWGL